MRAEDQHSGIGDRTRAVKARGFRYAPPATVRMTQAGMYLQTETLPFSQIGYRARNIGVVDYIELTDASVSA